MMTIRRLTPDEQEERQDRCYEELYAQIEANMLEDFEREFGAEYRAQRRYKPDGRRVHAAVMAQMQREVPCA